MVSASGVRIGWADLPGAVKDAVEDILGGAVVEAVSQPGGFSPGTADRVRTADGRRAFVKAASPAQNPRTPQMHRQEGRVTAALPQGVPAPRLLGSYDDGDWIALVLQDAPGRHPQTPWRADELQAVLATLGELSTVDAPAWLPTARDQLEGYFDGWRRVAADPPADLDPWAKSRLAELSDLADRGYAALTGDALVHLDVRADNLIIGAGGTVALVDWPHACAGPAWLDRLVLLLNVRFYGGRDTGAHMSALAADTGADPDDLIAVLAGLGGFFVDTARRPPAPGLPTLPAFQRAHAEAVLAWLREF